MRLGITPQSYEVRIYLDLDHTLAPGTTIARVRLAFPVTPSLAYY